MISPNLEQALETLMKEQINFCEIILKAPIARTNLRSEFFVIANDDILFGISEMPNRDWFLFAVLCIETTKNSP